MGSTTVHIQRARSWDQVPEADEYQVFFDCAETHAELNGPNQGRFVRQLSDEKVKKMLPRKEPVNVRRPSKPRDSVERPLAIVPEELVTEGGVPVNVKVSGHDRIAAPGHETFEHQELVPEVTRIVRDTWQGRVKTGELDEEMKRLVDAGGIPELEEWTTPEAVRRLLRAMCGDPEQASAALVRAIECRVRLREMFRTMHCKVVFDMRVIGRDKEGRPTIYMCGRSQTTPLQDCIPQLFVAFEAAVRISGGTTGQVVLVADMHMASTRLNLDRQALKYLADFFGAVFADRVNSILIVDFSRVAQAMWSLLQPFLKERTKKKINFIGGQRARNAMEERFNGPTAERILSAFDINRDKSSTDRERQLHAQRTAICNVPLGSLRDVDEAG